jgi:hypothetical protein
MKPIKTFYGFFMVSGPAAPIIKLVTSKEVGMPVEGVSKKIIAKIQGNGSPGDINRRGHEHWHLEDPHNKALAALVYTSVFKGAWDIVARSSGSLFTFFRASNRRVLSEPTQGNGSTSAP